MTFWEQFWVSFWPGLVAGLVADFIIGVVVVLFFIPWVQRRMQKADLDVIVKATPIDPPPEDGPATRLEFGIRNRGNVFFARGEIFWALYVHERLGAVRIEKPGQEAEELDLQTRRRDFVWEFKDMVNYATFPDNVSIMCTVVVKATNIQQDHLRYYLSTSHGWFPSALKKYRGESIPFSELARVVIVSTKK